MKYHLNISIDLEVIAEIKRRNLVVSPLINDFLKSYLKIPEKKQDNFLDLNVSIAETKANLGNLERKKEQKIKEANKGKKRVIVYGG